MFHHRRAKGRTASLLAAVRASCAPAGEREPDSQYRLLLERIVSAGVSVPTRQGPPALTLMQQAMHFDLANGFPLITERSLRSFWRKSIGELCAFINGATT